MARSHFKSQPTWTDVKTELAGFGRTALLKVIQELYTANKDNRMFLHARFGLGADVLKPYKEVIDRWLWPDVLRSQDPSVSKANQAISAYQKACGESAELAELMVFYCERAVGFCNDVGWQEESHFAAIVRMFEKAVLVVERLPAGSRRAFLTRLERVRDIAEGLGYGVGIAMDSALAEYCRSDD
jgi:hypothetical protein